MIEGGLTQAEVLQHGSLHRGGIGGGAVDGAEAVGAVLATEGVLAVGVLQEGVVDVVVRAVHAKLQFMRAQRPVAAEVGVGGLGLQHVEVAAALGAQQQVARAGGHARGAGRERAREGQRDLRQCHAVDGRGAAVVITLGNLGLGAERGRPVGKPLAHHAFQLLGLGVPVRAQRKACGIEAHKQRL